MQVTETQGVIGKDQHLATASAEPAAAAVPLATADNHAYFRGNYAPVAHETTAFDLPVDGELPKDLSGLLLRDGPNPAGPVGANHHWFVGDAMLHAIELGGGRARSYRNRWVRTERVEQVLGLPAAPRSPLVPPLQGSGNVHVIEHAGKLLALGEVGLPYELDRELHTRGQYDFAGQLSTSMTAHPKLDPRTGELLFFGYDFGPTNLRYHVAGRDGRLQRSVEITTPRPTMMHDFGVTQTRVVFMDLPVVADFDLILQGQSIPFRWDDTFQARLGVMPRDGGDADVRWIELDPCFVYHPLNSYDDGARIIMDVVRHDRTFDLSSTGPESSSLPKLCRWEIDPIAGRVTTRVLDERGQEFPRVDPRRETLPHRYGYATQISFDRRGDMQFGGLLKHDVVAGTTQVHDVGPGRSASEGVFVPRGPGEDEGYVLATVYDAASDRSDVIVLDAQNFADKPLATVHLPVRVPFGFHGNFVPSPS